MTQYSGPNSQEVLDEFKIGMGKLSGGKWVSGGMY